MHGLALIPLQRRLRDEGIVVRRFSYPSWLGSLTDNIDLLSTFVNESPGAIIHLVAHSLGGLIVLKMLSQETNARIGRVVLLGTPFAGCHCGVTIAATPMLAALVGRTLAEWFRLSRPALPSAVEIGVIAGTCSIGIGRLIRAGAPQRWHGCRRRNLHRRGPGQHRAECESFRHAPVPCLRKTDCQLS